jgi:hypothetical protein
MNTHVEQPSSISSRHARDIGELWKLYTIIQIHTYIHIYIYIYIYTIARLFVYIYIYTYVHTQARYVPKSHIHHVHGNRAITRASKETTIHHLVDLPLLPLPLPLVFCTFVDGSTTSSFIWDAYKISPFLMDLVAW